MLRDMLEQFDMDRLTVPRRTVTMTLRKGKTIGNGPRGQSWSLLAKHLAACCPCLEIWMWLNQKAMA